LHSLLARHYRALRFTLASANSGWRFAINPSVNSVNPQPRKHPPLLDLAAAPLPVVKAVLPVLGPLLSKWLKFDDINAVHDQVIETATPETFFSRTLQILGARYEVSESDLDRIPVSGPVVIVSNHPLGGLDGIILGDMLHRHRKDSKLMANFLLKKVMHADKHMFFVDPFPREEAVRANLGGLRDCMKHLKKGGLLGVFPGNRVSHWQWDRKQVCDPDWVPNVAALIRRSEATVVPVFIDGGNSLLFNLAGIVHPLLRTALLGRELIRQARDPEPVRLHVGTPIAFSRLKHFEKDEDLIAFLRLATYVLGHRPDDASPEKLAEVAEAQTPEPVAEALPPEKLEGDIAALPAEAKLFTQGEFDVFMARYQQLPHIMQEIGRGREISFRAAGGGTLKAFDLAPQDEYYHHLFVWNRKERVLVGAYRLGLSDEILAKHGPDGLICSGLFELKPKFLEQLNPGIELGRSYVLPEWQRNYSSLVLLWAGVLAFVAREPRYRMMFGSVGISQGNEYTEASRTLIVNFMREHLSHPTLAVQVESRSPFEGIKLSGMKPEEISSLVQNVEDVSTLVTGIEQDGKGVPILIKHYLRMNARLISFGVWKNHSNAVVSFIIADLTTSDPRFLKRYMGAEGYERFMAFHGVAEPKATD
jgi:putative hemolysin